MACSFIKNNSVFLHQTHRDQIVVYLKSPSPKKKTMAISFTKNNGVFLHQAQLDPEEFFRLGRFAVRRKVDFCKIGVPKFSENQDFFGPQTDLSAKILLEIFVYLKSPSPVNKKTMAFSLTRPSATDRCVPQIAFA